MIMMMDVSKLCFVCSNSNAKIKSSERQREKEPTSLSSSSSSSAKVLISYILLGNGNDSERNQLQLQYNILSAIDKGKLSICTECLVKAEHLQSLHLELEKIQMQILDVLRNLQDYLREKPSKVAKVQENLKENGPAPAPDLFRFHGVLHNEFIKRELSDKAQVRLERLNIAGYKNPIQTSRPPNDLDSRREEAEVSSRSRSRRSPVASVKHGLTDTSDNDYGDDDNDDDDEDFSPVFRQASENEDNEDGASKPRSNKDKLDVDINREMKRRNSGKVRERKKNEDIDELLSSNSSNSNDGGDVTDDDDDYCPEIDMDMATEEVSEPKMRPKMKRGPYRKKVTAKAPKKNILVWDCDICLEDIHFKEMETHLKTHPEEFEKYYICDICPGKRYVKKRVYGTYKGLVWHYLRQHHYVKMPCKLCPDSDQSIMFLRGQLCRHLYEVHHPGHKKLPCKSENCPEEFYDPESRSNHFKREHKESYTCEVCGKTLKMRQYLNNHMRRYHLQLEHFFCASCPKDFKTKGDLQRHEKNTHGHGTELHQCPQCPKRFSAMRLKYHLRVVHGERKFHCQFCTKSFPTSFVLKQHEEAHRAENKYMCSKCPYMGSTKNSLRIHMKSHDRTKLKCQYCDKAFATKEYRDDHQRTHLLGEDKELPYKCEICQAGFDHRCRRDLHRKKVHGIIKRGKRSLAGVGLMKADVECGYGTSAN